MSSNKTRPARGGRGSRRGSRRERIVFVVLAGVIFAVVLGFFVPAEIDASDYDSAARCSGAPGPSCVAVEHAVVQGVMTEPGGKSPSYWITLSGYGSIQLPSSDAVYRTAHDGDTATVSVWHGGVASISVDGVSSATQDSPDEIVRVLTGLLVGAIGLLCAALISLVRDRVQRLKRLGGAFSVWSGVSGPVIGIGYVAGPPWLVPVLAGLCLVALGLAVREITVLQPRRAAREAAESGWEKYLDPEDRP